ncbi:MAG: YitT family protein [Oscillospiraceae bacterium]|jgi:uncharacterized membrane-anchored protein YitT (DUF2179 family)|nr:YitT family protein [Oscillospiraceae bacterium]
MKTNRGRAVLDYVLILLGNVAYAAAVIVFIRPANVPVGGVSGLAQMASYLTGFPMGVLVILLNLPLFLLSFRSLGHRFLIRTAVSTVASSVMIDAFTPLVSRLLPDGVTHDPILQVLYGGVLMGLGLGLVFMRGATTGGSDIVAKLVTAKKTHISLGRVNFIIGTCVVLLSAFVYRRPEAALYAMVMQYVSAGVTNTLLSGMDNASAALIVTAKPEEMADAIFRELKRGCTGLDARGMYTGQALTTLLVAARYHETSRLKLIVQRIDPTGFMVFLHAREVLGQGFKAMGGQTNPLQ